MTRATRRAPRAPSLRKPSPRGFTPDLECLLGSLSPQEFLRNHWEKRPYRLSRRSADFYAPLVTRREVDHIVATALALDAVNVEVLRSDIPRERSADPTQLLDARALQTAYEAGSTIRVNAAHRFSPALLTLCRALEQQLSTPANVNLYCSPANAQGLPVHYDRHDVFVLQVSGRKRWNLYASVSELPLEYVPPLRFENPVDAQRFRLTPHQPAVPKDAPVLDSFVLEPGDLFYMPRGHAHEARTEGAHSIHLTVGLKVITYADCLASGIARLAHKDPRFRRALSPGFANGETSVERLQSELRALGEVLARELDPDEAVADVIDSFVRSTGRSNGMTLGSEDDALHLDTRTWVERRTTLLLRYTESPGKAALQFGNKRIQVPEEFGEALRFIIQTPRFQVGALPGGLSDESQRVLVSRLVREGLLFTPPALP